MKNKKFKGFSLAELLISLLIISIVLSAAIPTLTRRAGAGREFIWRWSQQQNNNAYFGVGSNQSAIIGAETIPLKGENLKNVIVDGEVDINNIRYSNNGDKLVLVKRTVYLGADGKSEESNFANSHISFYTAKNSSADATTADITYTGRIATDLHDLAFGIGTLQSLTETDTENTALGHYSLLKNTTGVENTAVGEKALSFNGTGSYNTAMGFKSLFNAGYNQDGGSSNETSSNTAIGYQSAMALKGGSNNSVLGALALTKADKGDDNVILGYNSMSEMTQGSYNVAIGSNACTTVTTGNNNICIGYQTGATSKKDPSGNPRPEPSNYGIFIGSSDNSMPIISGHSQKTDSFDKEININARTFRVQPHNAGTAIMRVDSIAADGDKVFDLSNGQGYGNGSGGYMGLVSLNLLQGGADTTTLFFRGYRDAITNEANKRIVLGTADINPASGNQNNIIDLSFNEKLALVFNNNDNKCSGNVCINTIGGDSDNSNTNLGLNNKLFINYDTNTPKVEMVPDSINISSGNKNNYSVNFNSPVNNDHIRFDLNDTYDNKSIPILYVESGSTSTGIGPEAIFSSNNVFTINKTTLKFQAIASKVPDSVPSPYGISAINLGISDKSDLATVIQSIWDQIKTTNSVVGDLYKSQTTSDARLKNISGDNTAGLKEINALEVKNFTYKADKNKTPHVGVIAQQLQKVFPNSVFKGEDGYLRITKEEIFYAMVNSIKELFKQIQDLTAKITGLDKRITELEKQNAQLKKQNAEFEKRLSRLEKASR